ncbi:MAG TPA: helix-turn-helix domain-containing protein [Bryobacteraceae bacterium]|jgi:DNA-binding transcriptional MerR regulator|nr:helix-turn-helix domain-containing protein [Bryobacteraceae bacterium]
MADEMTLAELADASGLAARTIRFYISRGLLDGPVKAGRAAAYTAEHLARLEKIKKLQAQGRMLSEIGRSLAGAVPERSAAPPTAWWQHVIADDVVVMTRNDVSPWRTKQIRDAIDELARSLRPTSDADGKRSRK